VLAAHARLSSLYRLSKESLIHNDLHFGNVLVGINETQSDRQGLHDANQTDIMPTGSLFLIDYEFATVSEIRMVNRDPYASDDVPAAMDLMTDSTSTLDFPVTLIAPGGPDGL